LSLGFDHLDDKLASAFGVACRCYVLTLNLELTVFKCQHQILLFLTLVVIKSVI